MPGTEVEDVADEVGEEAAENSNPLMAAASGIAGIGGFIFSIFEWYYQKKLQEWQSYWNALISDEETNLQQDEESQDMFQNLAMQYSNEATNDSNEVFSAPNSSYSTRYTREEDNNAALSDHYDQLANQAKSLESQAIKQLDSYRSAESHFSIWNSKINSDESFRIHNYHNAEQLTDQINSIKQGATDSTNVMSQIAHLQKELRNGNLTPSTIVKLQNQLNKLQGDLNNNKWNPNDYIDMIVKPITPMVSHLNGKINDLIRKIHGKESVKATAMKRVVPTVIIKPRKVGKVKH